MSQESQSLYSQGNGIVSSADFLPVIETRDPTSADAGYPVGKRWINKSNNSEWVMTSKNSFGGTVQADWEQTTVDGQAPLSKYIVAADGSADYTTIQAAINAAQVAGTPATVYVRPGTYTENLTLYSTINVAGSIDGNTTIIGVHTPPASGEFQFQDLTLTSATHIFSSAVAGTAVVFIEECFINVTNGYVFNLPNWTGQILANSCGTGSTNDGGVNNTGGALVYFTNANIGAGTGQTFTYSGSGASLTLEQVNIGCPMTLGSGVTANIRSGSNLFGTVTTTGTAIVALANSLMSTGATAAISHGSSGAFSVSNVTINSSANPCVAGAGAGALTLADVTFLNNAALAGTLTLGTAARLTTSGNLTLIAAGSKMIRTSVATTTTAGANSTGTVTLVGGTATVSTTAVATGSQVRIWRQSVGATGAAALGQLSVGTITNGTSFIINAWQAADATALQASDVSVIGWDIVN
jgi:hypothetical protein